jgi:hypothetical protein
MEANAVDRFGIFRAAHGENFIMECRFRLANAVVWIG